MGSRTSSSGAYGGPKGAGASYVVFGRNTAQNPFPGASVSLKPRWHDGFRLDGVAAGDRSGFAVSGAGM